MTNTQHNYENRIKKMSEDEIFYIVDHYSDHSKTLTEIMRGFRTKFKKNIETFMISMVAKKNGLPQRPISTRFRKASSK